ncbi:hypothetical protein [Methylophaga sp.]|uniref:hypothetical protein n=1 Tax=Methylophaga sp. TaxID=2024840 RepID=UPI0027159163|nr:hypothetical protein [Methylophaga sp.]MDO8826126.1 hypothetical protein [Methylophaga sp.]
MKPIKRVMFGFFCFSFMTTVVANDFDIVGLKIGMTFEEVEKTLLDYGAKPESIQQQHQFFQYTDGSEVHKTESFLHKLTAGKEVMGEKGRDQDSFVVYFSPLPEASRVVAITRVITTRNNPTTVGQYMAALNDKYGEPQINGSRLVWWFPEDKQSCYSSTNLVMLPDIDQIMKGIFLSSGKRYFLDRFQNTKLTSVDDCAGYLVYSMGALQPDAPANNVTATMIDAPTWVKANLKSMDWVEQLQTQATEARLGASSKPTL